MASPLDAPNAAFRDLLGTSRQLRMHAESLGAHDFARELDAQGEKAVDIAARGIVMVEQHADAIRTLPADPALRLEILKEMQREVESVLDASREAGTLRTGTLSSYLDTHANHPKVAQASELLNKSAHNLGGVERALESYDSVLRSQIEVAQQLAGPEAELPDFALTAAGDLTGIEQVAGSVVETVIPAPSGPGYDGLAPDPRVVGQFPWLERTARKGFNYDQPVDLATGRPGLIPDLTGAGTPMVTLSGRQISAAQSLDASYGDELKIGEARVGAGSLTAGELDAESFGYDRSRS